MHTEAIGLSARKLIAALLSLIWLPTAVPGAASQLAGLQFNRDVRPILADTCFRCHGFDKPARKADLRLDIRNEAIKIRDGVAPIVPGDPAHSDAYRRIISDDPDEMMPPPKSKLTLTDAQKSVIKLWIQQGAEYQPHWAFIPVKRPELPAVQLQGWVKNDLDRFVLAKLESVGLSPSPEADRRTLIRRLSLDLTGLPPTPAEVDSFLADASPNAYEKVVDRLLASPGYGERMAMYWLDGARYADSNGYQADYQRFMSPWRDWVINAFNQNEPFDQFTIDQLAGDLRPNATLQQKLATGFNRNHRINTEGGVIPEEWHVETVIDRVETTSNVWLGLTIGCCRCHDHKYDPITQKEFYQFYSFFNNVPERGNGDGERPINHTPVLMLPRPGDETKLAQLESKIADARKARDAAIPAIDAAQTEWEKSAGRLAAWEVLDPLRYSSTGGATFTKLEDKSLLLSGTNPATDVQEIRFQTRQTSLTGLRLETMQDRMLPGKGPGRSQNGNFVLTDIEVEAAPLNAATPPKKIALTGAAADYSQDNFNIAKAIDSDPKTGWAIDGKKGSHVATFAFAEPFGFPDGTELHVRLHYESEYAQHVIGRLRMSVTTSSSPLALMAPPPKVVDALALPAAQRTADQTGQITDYYRTAVSTQWKQLQSAVDAAQKTHDDFEAGIPNVMVMQEMPTPRDSYILIRGQYDKHGDRVTPGTPAALPKMPPGAPMNRLGLAEWIVDPGNPLTARVWVNRAWERFFGIGIVKTSENMGVQADPPSNADLLDWLAAEFVHPTTATTSGGTPATAWDMKALQKTIVMSATYRQSSAITPQLEEQDPDNRLLARGPRFRLQAELVRDNALAIAGLLVDKIGGDPVRPYQPDGIWNELTEYGNLRNYQHDKGEGLYRRSLYTIWKRTAAPPQMTTFDMPSREICVVKRSRTNTPLQALVLLNDVTYVEAARALGQRMLEEGGATPESRLSFGFRLATARAPDDRELQVLSAGLKRHEAVYRSDVSTAKKLLSEGDSPPDPKLDPVELAAYTITASVILNLDETITKE